MRSASLSSERSSDGTQTYIRIDGVINERLDGKRAAARIKSKSVVLNCAGVALITSYGVRAWFDFVRALERRKIELYFVECSTAFVRETNQVIDFVGPGQVVSCYLPYACPACSAQRTVLLRVDLDKHVVRDREPDEYSCLVCGSTMEFDEEPGLFFPGLDNHVGGSVNPKVLEFLKARLNYGSDSQTRLKVLKDVSGDTTVLSIAGTLDGTLNGPALAEGLQGEVAIDLNNIIHVQQQGLRAWRNFIGHVNPERARLWLMRCPTLIVEKAHDPQSNLHLVSVRIPYYCHSCEQTEFVLVEIASRDGRALAQGQLRERPCSGCKEPTKPMVSASVVQTLSQLPDATPPRSVQKAASMAAKRLAKARQVQTSRQSQGSRFPRWVPALAVIAVVGAGLAVAAGATVLWKTQTVATAIPPAPERTGSRAAAAERPDWIISDTPSSSYCVDLGWQLRCVGVSSYHESLDAAEKEGFEAAVEVFVHTALLNARSEALEVQRSAYLKARIQAINDLERGSQMPDVVATQKAREAIRLTRARIASAVRSAGAPGAPTQRSSHYWEEYEVEGEAGKTEFLAFIRVDVSNPEVLAFSKYYTTKLEAGGAVMTRLTPSLSWVLPADTTPLGLFVITPPKSGPAGTVGLEAHDVILTGEALASDHDPVVAVITKFDAGKSLEIRRGSMFSERFMLSSN
jgi:hypothetical protein